MHPPRPPHLMLLVLLTACSAGMSARSSSLAGGPGLDAFAAQEGFVLVWDDAPLFLDADATARQLRLRDLGQLRRGQPGSGVIALELAGVRQGFVEVQTPGGFQPGAFCDAQPIPGLERLRLRLFVQPQDIARVTTRAVALGDDLELPRAGLALEPGLVVLPAEAGHEGLSRVLVGPLVVHAPLPADAVGRVFTPNRRLVGGDEERALAPLATLRLPRGASARRAWSGDVDDAAQLVGADRASRWAAPTYVHRMKRHPGGAWVQVRTTCAELAGVLPADQVVRAEHPEFQTPAAIATAAGPAWRIRRRAALSWTSGGPAGEVARRVLLAREPAYADDTARLSIWPGESTEGPDWSKLTPREARRLDLRVARADVIRARRAFRPGGSRALRALGAGAAALSRQPEADTFEATVRSRIARRMPRVTRCYQHEIGRSKAPLEGRLLLEIALDDRGQVEEIVVEEDNLGRPDLERCVIEQMLKVRYPRPPDGEPLRFTHPIVFQRGDLPATE